MRFRDKRRLPRLSPKETAAVLVSGILLGLSQPLALGGAGAPVDESGLSGLLALGALVPLLVIARGAASMWRAFALGAAAFWIYFVIVAHWLVVPFAKYGGVPGPLAFVAVLAITAAVALPFALPVALVHGAEKRLGWPAWASFPAALCAVELLRHYVPFGGMPWASTGSALASVDHLRQGASLFGVSGLGFVVGLVNGAGADAWAALRSRRRLPVLGVVVTVAVLTSLMVYGAVRLGAEANGPTVTVGILQPSIPQHEANSRKLADVNRTKYVALQDEALRQGATIVVWPESALTPSTAADRDSLLDADVMSPFAVMSPPSAIIGGISWRKEMDDETGRPVRHQWGSAFVTGAGLEVVGRYDKVRLVPFGEYVPWPFSLISETPVTGGRLTPGKEPLALPLPALHGEKVGITICWDGLFPDVTRALANDGAVQLYNLTNDAWYDRTSEPWQHLNAYALRATETARPLVRAANSGVSGWFDSRGRFFDGTRPFEKVARIAEVPTSTESTIYLRFGDWLAWPAVLFTLLLALRTFFGRRRAPTLLT